MSAKTKSTLIKCKVLYQVGTVIDGDVSDFNDRNRLVTEIINDKNQKAACMCTKKRRKQIIHTKC